MQQSLPDPNRPCSEPIAPWAVTAAVPRLAALLALATALASCNASSDPHYPFGKAPWVQQQQDLAAEIQRREISTYGYQAYAECRGRGLNFASNAMTYCLEAQQMHNGRPEAPQSPYTGPACDPSETVMQCDRRLQEQGWNN